MKKSTFFDIAFVPAVMLIVAWFSTDNIRDMFIHAAFFTGNWFIVLTVVDLQSARAALSPVSYNKD